jgi:mono/diheme cytochrome c family protein
MKRGNLFVIAVLFAVFGASLIISRSQAEASATVSARTASQLYSKYCVSCHGRNGRSQTTKGKFSHARDLTDSNWQDDVSDERLFNSIMNGRNVRGNMPAFSDKLNEQEADSLVGYVRKFRK